MGKEFASHTIYKGSLDVKSQTTIFFKDDTGEYIYDRKQENCLQTGNYK